MLFSRYAGLCTGSRFLNRCFPLCIYARIRIGFRFKPHCLDLGWGRDSPRLTKIKGLEAALMSGAGHLLSFTGSDTIPCMDFLEEYYNADTDK